MSELRHSIKTVARKTGLTPHVIRVWERRYKAVEPARTGTNRRLYSDHDVERLGLLKQATQAGHNISNVAGLSTEQLLRISAEAALSIPHVANNADAPEKLIEQCLDAVKALNTHQFEEVLTRGILALGQHGVLERVIGPLTQMIGDLWRDGTIMASHEHFASAAIRNFLGRNSKPFVPMGHSPTLIVGTPSGQLHELGAVMVAAAASDLGWRVVYLGPSLPAAEIASAALQNQARAVALSIVYPEDDPNLPQELEQIRRYLPAQTELFVGGRAAEAYSGTLDRLKVNRVTGLKDFYARLESLRVGPVAR